MKEERDSTGVAGRTQSRSRLECEEQVFPEGSESWRAMEDTEYSRRHGFITASQREVGGERLGKALNHPFSMPRAGHTCFCRAAMSLTQGLRPPNTIWESQENPQIE